MNTERCRWLWRSLLILAGAIAGAPGQAAEAPEPAVTAQAAHQVTQPQGLAARLLGDQPSPVRSLDPAIFTELAPVTASEPALALPEDQQDDD